jgi:3-mercaptopyruvate sulfurtransferase SseA
VAAAPAGDWKVFEAAWGAPKLYLLSHIPGAGYIARARDMAQQIELRRPPGGLKYFPVAGRGGGHAFPLLQALSDALSQGDRLQKLPHFEQLVYPQWLHDLQQGKTPGGLKYFPVAGRGGGHAFPLLQVVQPLRINQLFNLLSHIPGAGYIDTNEVESEPLWNKVSDAQLKAMLRQHRLQLRIGHFIPQRFALHLIGIDIARARDMASTASAMTPR